MHSPHSLSGLRGAHRALALTVVSSAALLAACASRDARPAADSLDVALVDLARPLPTPPARAPRPRPTAPHLSALADSIAQFLVLAPEGELWFTAASRNKRVVVDIGRVDTDVRRDSARAAAYREAVEKRSPVTVGATFRLRGPWGAFDVKAVTVDSWNGRIVLRISGPPALDSLGRGKAAVVATALRTDSAAEAIVDSCERAKPLETNVAARVAQVRDSLERELRTGPQPSYERLRRKMTLAASQVTGCFGPSRVALAVSLKAGNVEWVRERLVLIDTAGKVTPLRLSDFRFRAHELLQAFDADGDGVDDLATRATTERAGATTVLVLDLKARRARRLTAGFAWEDQ